MVAGVGRQGGGFDAHAPSLTLFPRDVWKNNPAENRQWHILALLKVFRRRITRPVRALSGASPALDSAQSEDMPRLPGSLAAAARGLREDASALLGGRRNAVRFQHELASFIAEAALEPGDLVYMPTVLAVELGALERLLDRSRAARRLRWRLMLRYAPHAGSVRRDMARITRRLAARRDVDLRFFSDTEQLCRMYQALCATPFSLLPIPVDLDLPAVERSSTELVIGYFGDARDEKGFDLLPSVIRRVREKAPDGRSIRFVVQTNLNTSEGDPGARAARLELMGLGGADLDLVEGPLAPEAYQSLLRTANIMILPYESSAYAERSSGVLMEALMAGAPCVVTSGGWMASMIQAGGTDSPAGVVVAADAHAIGDGVLHIAAEWTRYAQGARALREQLRPRFDPAELVRLVTDKT